MDASLSDPGYKSLQWRISHPWSKHAHKTAITLLLQQITQAPQENTLPDKYVQAPVRDYADVTVNMIKQK